VPPTLNAIVIKKKKEGHQRVVHTTCQVLWLKEEPETVTISITEEFVVQVI
jgi:hypothetical protein